MRNATRSDLPAVRPAGEFLASGRHLPFLIRIQHSHDLVPGAAALSTQHPHYELSYVEKGQGRMYVQSQFAPVRPGDAFLLPPNAFHLHPDPSHYAYWSLCFDADAVDWSGLRNLSESPLRRISISEKERPRWESRFRYLRDELKGSQVQDPGIIVLLLRSILLDATGPPQKEAGRVVAGRREVLDTIFRVIDSEYNRTLRLRDIASVVNFSPAYLTDLVRRETGRPIHQWIAVRRVRAAQTLLADTDLAIGAVAEEVGFRDPTYFGRYFLRVTGLTPRAWRDAYRAHAEPFRYVPWPQDGVALTARNHLSLHRLRKLCSASLTPNDIETVIITTVAEIFRPCLIQILLKDRCSGRFAISRQVDTSASCSSSAIRKNEDVVPSVVDGESVIASDLKTSPIMLFKNLGRLGFRALLIAPIMVRGECVGTIRVLDRDGGLFSEHDRSILTTITTIAGLAFASAVQPTAQAAKN